MRSGVAGGSRRSPPCSAVALWAVFYGSAAGSASCVGTGPHRPAGRSPDRALVADLKRLRAATLEVEPGTSHVRRNATLAAYDDALVQACRALGLPDNLTDLPPGTDREAERLRVEALLEAAGLRFTSTP